MILFFLLLLFSSCSNHYLSLEKETIDRRSLASTFVQSPDPLQENPPLGEQILISWKIPATLLEEKPKIHFDIIYGDFTEEHFIYPLEENWSYTRYCLTDKKYIEKNGIISYKAAIVTDRGEVYLDWTHQLWVDLINIQK